MYLFISYFGVIDPLCCMILQELFEVDTYSRIRYESMHQYVVVFVFALSFDLLEIFHRHGPFLCLAGYRLHMIDEGLTEVFRYIFGISLDEVPPIFRGFKEQAKFLALAPLDFGWILLVGLVGVSTILAG